MKSSNVAFSISIIVSIILAGPAFAVGKISQSEINKGTVHVNTAVINADEYLVKDNDSIVKAETLHKGQVVLGNVGEGKVVITGQLIVKLIDSVSAKQFADDYELNLVLSTGTNLNVFEPENDGDLVSILETLKSDRRVVRASLDKSKERNSID